MISKFARLFVTMAFALAATALAQTDNASGGLPAAPSAATAGGAATATAPAVTNATGTKVGTINVEQAIFASNEGQRDFEQLSKKLEPKQTELKGLNDEVENLRKQLNSQSATLNDQARGTLVKQIEDKQKRPDRQVQDAREDAQSQQNEIAQRILQKMAPVLVKYATDNGYGVIIDTSNQWPNGPVLWAGPAVDITKPVVDAYNAQSGVPAPAKPATAKPATGLPGTRPASGNPAARPAAPPAKPPVNQPPK